MLIACPHRAQVEGAYFFSRSQLLQPGRFDASGKWLGDAAPLLGGVEDLRRMAPIATA